MITRQKRSLSFVAEGFSGSAHTGGLVFEGVVNSFVEHALSYFKCRCKLEEDGVIVDSVFQQDYEFSAPSAASAVVLGRTSNGNVDWKAEDGTRLKDL